MRYWNQKEKNYQAPRLVKYSKNLKIGKRLCIH